MARRKHHEEHVNHEAWAIPYGDLITLLLAFFVVMYAVSSINEGKYRVLSDSLQAAFRGAPRSLDPIQLGNQVRSTTTGSMSGQDPVRSQPAADEDGYGRGGTEGGSRAGEMQAMADRMESALDDLIEAETVTVLRSGRYVEIEIKNEILFPTASANISGDAKAVLDRLAGVLAPLTNVIRVEGHTDNRPIATEVFPSNWELSAARAAGIVRAFEDAGVDPKRMIVAGMGEYHPVADNATAEGRQRNRRVALVILDPVAGDQDSATDHEEASAAVAAGNDAAPEAGAGGAT